MPYYAPTHTVNDVKVQVRKTFGDEAAVQVADADIIQWTNDAQQEIVDRNKILKAKNTISSVVGQSDYTFPTINIVEVDALQYNGMLLPNIPFAEAQQTYVGQVAQAGAEPTVWWEYAGVFTLWPTPPTIKNIDVYATIYPPKLTLLTDTLGLSDKFYRQIIQYVLQQCYELDEDLQMAEYKQGQFGSGLQNYAEEERTAQNMQIETITLVDWDSDW